MATLWIKKQAYTVKLFAVLNIFICGMETATGKDYKILYEQAQFGNSAIAATVAATAENDLRLKA